MANKYYLIKVRVKGGHLRSWHIIRAKSMKDALRIRNQYGISYPRYETNITQIEGEKIDLRKSWCQRLLERRRKHHGGSIWYEENNELKTEEWKEPNK